MCYIDDQKASSVSIWLTELRLQTDLLTSKVQYIRILHYVVYENEYRVSSIWMPMSKFDGERSIAMCQHPPLGCTYRDNGWKNNRKNNSGNSGIKIE